MRILAVVGARLEAAHPFQAQPAPWPRLQRQMNLASTYTVGRIVAFSVPEYLPHPGGTGGDTPL